MFVSRGKRYYLGAKYPVDFVIIISYAIRANGIIVLFKKSTIDWLMWTFQFDLNEVTL